MSVSIKVGIRCRPYTIDDQLGVFMKQNSLEEGKEDGEVNLLNSEYTTNRFAFTWSWWSAYGFKRHLLPDEKNMQDMASQMELVDQVTVYNQVGRKIKKDLLEGNAVVMFAYGLSGSGKTYTVFGPDAADVPEAWFKHKEPTDMWGIFPRLGYEICKEKQDGWVLRMKYFQNIVDTVRDLIPATISEQSYKSGMSKDPDGFMDIKWCESKVIKDWDDLRHTFMAANSRKAIAPTQFNHQSTRGHCVMTLELEMPHPDVAGMKQRGRLYVCDLAGTEPAGDIVYAQYKKVEYKQDDGTVEVEHKYIGPHPDHGKSKELQEQGKKINLSLSEMAQFFMKMAVAVKKKTLKPGKSIPGCNTYFLCKYLKDTMLQARTYLFCAIRPEVKYLNYTFSTLGFAKNASVIKLSPVKATAGMSAGERKLMAELDEMKALVTSLNAQIACAGSGGESGGESDGAMRALQHALEAKQAQLASALSGDNDGPSHLDTVAQEQRESYGKRGIALTQFESDTSHPYLVNLESDPFRSKRFMYILQQESTTFGRVGHSDINLLGIGTKSNHCRMDIREGHVFLVGQDGEVVHNGKSVKKDDEVELAHLDRVAMGGEITLFILPGEKGKDEMSADEAYIEYENAIESGGLDQAALEAQQAAIEKAREEEKHRLEQEKQQEMANMQAEFDAKMKGMGGLAEQEKKLAQMRQEMDEKMSALEAQAKAKSEAADQVFVEQQGHLSGGKSAVEKELKQIFPKIQDLQKMCQLMNRPMLAFDVSLTSTNDGDADVMIKVSNTDTSETILLEKFNFITQYSLCKDHYSNLKMKLMTDSTYVIEPENDPIVLFYEQSYEAGVASSMLMWLAHYMSPETDKVEIRDTVAPFDPIGTLHAEWVPLFNPEDPGDGSYEDPHGQLIDDLEVEEPSELIGLPWTFKLKVKQATGLPVQAATSYFQYDFFGETFTSEAVQQSTRSPVYNYECVHHVESVTEEFVEWLTTGQVAFTIHITPLVIPPSDSISTENETIRANFSVDRQGAQSIEPGPRINVTAQPAPLKKKLSVKDNVRMVTSKWKTHTSTRSAAHAKDVKDLQNQLDKVTARVEASGSGAAEKRVAELEHEKKRLEQEVTVLKKEAHITNEEMQTLRASQATPCGDGSSDMVAELERYKKEVEELRKNHELVAAREEKEKLEAEVQRLKIELETNPKSSTCVIL